MKPPADPATDNWTWNAWAKEMAAMAFPGWSPCRFAHCTQPKGEGDMARFVFGIVRGPFGIWEKPYEVCSVDDEGRFSRSTDGLFTLTHLPTGYGVGLFIRKEYAALAADTAIRACPGWSEDLIGPEIVSRTFECWHKVGITNCTDAHAHDKSNDSGPYAIMGLDVSSEEGKPEKLS